MRKLINWIVAVLCCLLLVSCGQSAETKWQEQYDLGIRCLSEGNYEEAIIAFTAAIEIDPKQAPAYVGRGDAYIGSGETGKNLAEAQADYEMAIELDETNAQAYLGLADVYIRKGDYDKALEVLRDGMERTNNDQRIIDKVSDIEDELSQDMEPWGNRDSDDYSPEQKQYIEHLVNAVEKNEREVAWELLKRVHIGGNGYFAFSGYRIRMYDWSTNHSDSIGGSIEIHPKDGQGFHCSYTESEDGHFDKEYLVGECEDWNWNGSFEDYKRYYYPDYADTITVRSGMMRDGLLDGNVKVTIKRTFVGESAMHNDYEQTYDEPYDMGVMTRFEDSTTVYSASSGYTSGGNNWDWRLPQ